MTQRAEEILNGISNIIKGTYTGLISVLLGFRKCVAWNPGSWGVEGPCWLARPILPYFGELAKIGCAG